MSKPEPKPQAAPIAVWPRLRISCGDEIALGPGKAELLALIQETGSIQDSANRMRMSYMRAWSLIQTMNRCFKEPLVTAARGGRGGGGAKLTPAGSRVLELYQRMEKASLAASQPAWRTLREMVKGKV